MPNTSPFETHAEKYDSWFTSYPHVFQAELQAIKTVFSKKPMNLEVGVGTGRFASQLGIRYGVEPSATMSAAACRRGIHVMNAVAEHLPLSNATFDTVLMITVVCFLGDVPRALREVKRVLKNGGNIIVAIIDKHSFLGEKYAKHQHENIFYRYASFWSSHDMITALRSTGFSEIITCQTIFQNLNCITKNEPVQKGFGRGGFVVVRGTKG